MMYCDIKQVLLQTLQITVINLVFNLGEVAILKNIYEQHFLKRTELQMQCL